MAKRVRSLRCPICRQIVLKSEPEFPFCSDRCRTIDLGKWASGAYVVSSPAYDVDESEMREAGRSRSSGDDDHDLIQ